MNRTRLVSPASLSLRSSGAVAVLGALFLSSMNAIAAPQGYWQQESVDSRKKAEDESNPCYKYTYTGGQGGATLTRTTVCGNRSVDRWTGSASGTWSAPPSVLVPGQKVQMSVSARVSATHGGIDMSASVLADIDSAPCSYKRDNLPIVSVRASTAPGYAKAAQKQDTAIVPDYGWGSGVKELNGRLQIKACMDGWQTYFLYAWKPGPAPPNNSSPTTKPVDVPGHDTVKIDHDGGGHDSGTGANLQTHSMFTSITPDQRQFAAQPGGVLPLIVRGGDSPYFEAGNYMIYVGPSDPNGMEISCWKNYGPFTLSDHDKWRATMSKQSKLTMERNERTLLQYSDPGPKHALIYARNDDVESWETICVLPVGWDATQNCFPGYNNVRYVPARCSDEYDNQGQMKRLFDNSNDGGVSNQPILTTSFTLSERSRITKITTYHWNNGKGTPAPGTIALRNSAGRLFGPWQAGGQPGSGGAPNAYWIVLPALKLPAGSYTVIDSNPATWSQNSGTRGAGMAWIEGHRF